MNFIARYYLITPMGYDLDGYRIPDGKIHLAISQKTFCGTKIKSTWKVLQADKELKQWLIDKTTCKTCKKIVSKKFYKEQNGLNCIDTNMDRKLIADKI